MDLTCFVCLIERKLYDQAPAVPGRPRPLVQAAITLGPSAFSQTTALCEAHLPQVQQQSVLTAPGPVPPGLHL